MIPAAGLGTRLLPATKALPKELLPVGDMPAFQFILEECWRAGILELIVVVSEDKAPLRRYLTPDPEILTLPRSPAAALDRLEEILGEMEIRFVLQKEPRGLGHAVLMAEEAAGGEPFAVLLPDDLYPRRGEGIEELVSHYPEGILLGLMEVPPEATSRYGIVDGPQRDRDVIVRGMVEKPPEGEAPSRLAILGRYILPPEIFAALQSTPPGSGGEIQLTDGIAILLKAGVPVQGRVLAGVRLDVGDQDGYVDAWRRWVFEGA